MGLVIAQAGGAIVWPHEADACAAENYVEQCPRLVEDSDVSTLALPVTSLAMAATPATPRLPHKRIFCREGFAMNWLHQEPEGGRAPY
jgi:hypothetical protein